MRICIAHNYYRQAGGERQVFEAEAGLLERHGHRVVRFEKRNDAVSEVHPVTLAAQTVWNQRVYREVRARLQRERIDVVHVHNTLPIISPAVYYAAHAEGVPVVQTLHNYRLLCPGALLMREGRVCEACIGKPFAMPAVRHGCYRESRAATAAVASMLGAHRALGTWDDKVTTYIALTDFARGKFIQGGLPPDRVAVKPNFYDADLRAGTHAGGYALFVGRLSQEKGLSVLLDAWGRLERPLPLKVVGDGPMLQAMTQTHGGSRTVELLGRRSREEVVHLMQDAAFLVMPSLWYEGFPMTIVEAFATGLPVVASNLGSMASIIEHGRTGLHFTPGDADDLAAKVRWALERPDSMEGMQRAARAEYEAKYTAEHNYRMLMDIYRQAIERRTGTSSLREAA